MCPGRPVFLKMRAASVALVIIAALAALTVFALKQRSAAEQARAEALSRELAANALVQVIDRAIQVHGARGLTDETPLAQMALHARAARIYDGPDEVHRMVVARRILSSFRKGEGWAFG